MAVRVEELVDKSLEFSDYGFDMQQAYLAFQKGDPYYLPVIYRNHPHRHLIGRDLNSINGEPIKAEPISERILSWEWERGVMRTILYITGPYIEGYTFANLQNPWRGNNEALALRVINVGVSPKDTRITPEINVPESLVGTQIRALGLQYREAFGTRDVKRKTEIAREIRQTSGLRAVMVGANGPSFRLAGY